MDNAKGTEDAAKKIDMMLWEKMKLGPLLRRRTGLHEDSEWERELTGRGIGKGEGCTRQAVPLESATVDPVLPASS
jgi:hypothetical protein